ncbi:MAG: threonylcarbamoyl-AMP synthase [Bacteroidetes bacterium]|nr:threonylcarbamoyl-AMP synthase [Bacteroidota bacterium]
MAIISGNIKEAAKLLEDGFVISIPTETVYGLAGNAFNHEVVAKIFEIKNRPHFNPLIIHSNSIDKIAQFAEITGSALKLAQKFWPGPLTLLVPKKPIVSDLITAGYSTVAVRIPGHPLTLQLLELIDFPLAAPSANPFGYVSPTIPEHVESQLGNEIPYILDGGPCSIGLESTIAGFDEDDNLVIYRVGGLPVEELEMETGKKAIYLNDIEKLPKTPGMLKSHYATKTPLVIGKVNTLMNNFRHDKIGVISLKTIYPDIPIFQQMELSQTGDLNEAARNLFSAMRKLDAMGLEVIIAEKFPEEGLGRAINDRLMKAAHVG